MQCQNLESGNDTTSSLAVYRTNLGMYALGDWISITATEGVDFYYHKGFKTMHSEEEY